MTIPPEPIELLVALSLLVVLTVPWRREGETQRTSAQVKVHVFCAVVLVLGLNALALKLAAQVGGWFFASTLALLAIPGVAMSVATARAAVSFRRHGFGLIEAHVKALSDTSDVTKAARSAEWYVVVSPIVVALVAALVTIVRSVL